MNIIQKTEYHFDPNRVRSEVFACLERFPNNQQIGLTHTFDAKTAEERMNESTGDMRYNLKRKIDKDFVIFNKDFNGTIFQTMYETLSKDFTLCRFRIMKMEGPSTYYAHSDPSERLHYAVETNSDCVFLFPEIKQQFFIPQDGFVYKVDTRHRHTFVNASRTKRIHLVLSLFP